LASAAKPTVPHFATKRKTSVLLEYHLVEKTQNLGATIYWEKAQTRDKSAVGGTFGILQPWRRRMPVTAVTSVRRSDRLRSVADSSEA